MIEPWVYLNGNFLLEKNAFIPITDRGFLFGEGIFTTLRVHQGKCELLSPHLARLQRQVETLGFAMPTIDKLIIQELIERNHAFQGTWRLKIILSVQNNKSRKCGTVLVTLHPYESRLSDVARLCVFPHPIESPLAHLKSLSYLDHLYVKEYARQKDYEDALTMNSAGSILETGSSNIFWIDQETCFVPDLQLPYLKGVFLTSILSRLSLPIVFVKSTIDQIQSSAHLYLCNSLTHIRPVISLEQRLFTRNQEKEHLLHKLTNEILKND